MHILLNLLVSGSADFLQWTHQGLCARWYRDMAAESYHIPTKHLSLHTCTHNARTELWWDVHSIVHLNRCATENIDGWNFPTCWCPFGCFYQTCICISWFNNLHSCRIPYLGWGTDSSTLCNLFFEMLRQWQWLFSVMPKWKEPRDNFLKYIFLDNFLSGQFLVPSF